MKKEPTEVKILETEKERAEYYAKRAKWWSKFKDENGMLRSVNTSAIQPPVQSSKLE